MGILGIISSFICLKHLDEFIIPNKYPNSLRNSLELHWSKIQDRGWIEDFYGDSSSNLHKILYIASNKA